MQRNLLFLWVCWLSVGTCWGQSFVESVYPASMRSGSTTRVRLRGSQMDHARTLWSSLPEDQFGVQIVENGRDYVVCDVTIDKEVVPGFYGLRLATGSGLSNAHLFLVDQLTPVREAPEGSSAAQVVVLPAAVQGICERAGLDRFKISVESGETISFEVVGNRLGKDFDPLLVLRDEQGREIAYRDNDAGLFFDCRFEHTFAESGTVTVELRDTRFHGSEHWPYVLRMGKFPAVLVALPTSVIPGEEAFLRFPQIGEDRVRFVPPKNLSNGPFYFALRRENDAAATWVPLLSSKFPNIEEMEPNDHPAQASVGVVPCILHGMIDREQDQDWFALNLKKGESIQLKADSKLLGSPTDVLLVVRDPSGSELKRADDSGLDEGTLVFTAKKEGVHHIRVTDVIEQGGASYVYRVTVSRREPTISLGSGVARLAIPRKNHQPLPLTLARSGYSGPVQLVLEGAPEGMRMSPDVIPEGVSELSARIEIDDSVAVGVYSIRVSGTATHKGKVLRCMAQTRPLLDRIPAGRGPHGEPFELREDQLRLPPSLTDQIAILVSPISPYSFDVAQSQVTLPRFLHAAFQIKTTRRDGFDRRIKFLARGGSLEPDGQMRRQVTSEIPDATPGMPVTTGVLRSGVLSRPTSHQVTVTASAKHDGDTISLTRTFRLSLQPAFKPYTKPARVELNAGETTRVRVFAGRLAPFDGPITVELSQLAGVVTVAEVKLGESEESIELEVAVPESAKPGSYEVQLSGDGRVNKFQERINGEPLKVIVK